MPLYQYPKLRHVRSLKPPVFKRYQTYKRFLQVEFSRLCVYCREPDSISPNVQFQVDHYRPKSIPKFASLVCEYGNLYYCCGLCNSRKNADWPADESEGPFVVNPCDHEMWLHLRFDAKTGRVEARTPNGSHTEYLLQLNDETRTKYRFSAISTAAHLEALIAGYEKQLGQLKIKLKSKKIVQADFDELAGEVSSNLEPIRHMHQRITGQLPLAPLKKSRGTVTLLA